MTFLWWYGPALVVAVVIGLWLKRVTGAVPRWALTFEEIGYLGGGPVRAVEVAVAGLVAENRARVSGSVVTAVPVFDDAQPATALQGVVLARLARPRDLDELVVGAATSGPARQIGQRLVAGGLLVAPRRRLVRAVLAVLPLALLAVVAAVVGPAGWMTVTALSVTGALAVLLLLGPPPVLTRRGARAYEEATAGLAPVDPAEVTARYGLTRTAAPPTGPAGSGRTGSGRDRSARTGSARDESTRVDTAVFNGERAEPITPAETSHEPLPRRRRAVVVEPQRWQRRNGWLVAGGWFAGGWLAGQYLAGDGAEGDDGGEFLDTGFGGFDA